MYKETFIIIFVLVCIFAFVTILFYFIDPGIDKSFKEKQDYCLNFPANASKLAGQKFIVENEIFKSRCLSTGIHLN
jgi:hypothetical protein